MTAGPADPGRRADWRRQRRQVMRRLHPDRGGDAEVYFAALAEVDRAFGIRPVSPAAGSAGVTVRAHRARRLRLPMLRAARAGVRGARARLPRRVPGARRYIDL